MTVAAIRALVPCPHCGPVARETGAVGKQRIDALVDAAGKAAG